ncbi:MAG: hypothetical protein KatS3mg107_0526 [Gemmataceae bacterium]|nr:MAG: hypothetical protein KatS3mg107_0526 [Gemmataceae bacterium]
MLRGLFSHRLPPNDLPVNRTSAGSLETRHHYGLASWTSRDLRPARLGKDPTRHTPGSLKLNRQDHVITGFMV